MSALSELKFFLSTVEIQIDLFIEHNLFIAYNNVMLF